MSSSSSNTSLSPGEKLLAEYQGLTPRQKFVKTFNLPIQLGKLVFIFGFISIWWAAYHFAWINPGFIASPRMVWNWYIENYNNHDLWYDTLVTLREAFYGWIIGSTLGVFTGLMFAIYPKLWKMASPLMTFLNAVPRTALVPIFILWFGVAETTKVLIALTLVYFIVMDATRSAAAMIDPDLETVMTTMGGQRRHLFFKLTLPAVLSSAFGSIRLAAVWALLGATFAELFGSRNGLGIQYNEAANKLLMGEAFGIVTIIAFLAIAINVFVKLIENRLMRWKETSNQGSVVTV
ncbi:MAG: ABC transporter permease [bacterium]